MEGRIDNDLGAKIADSLVTLCAANKIPLDFSPMSLLTLDSLLGPFGGEGVAGNEGLIEAAAAYYGEVVRRSLGGDWRFEIPPDGDWGLEIPPGTEQMVWCAATVYKHFAHGGKSVAAIYNVIASNLGAATIEGVPEVTQTVEVASDPMAKLSKKTAAKAAKKPAAKKPAAKATAKKPAVKKPAVKKPAGKTPPN